MVFELHSGTHQTHRTSWHVLGLTPVLVLLLLPSAAAAHEVPNDVTVQAFVRPEGERLRLLVRVPIEALAEVDWPRFGPGYLDLAALESVLDDAATLLISGNLESYEDGDPLPEPRAVQFQVSIPSEGSFASYEEALAHVRGPGLPEDTELFWESGMLDILFEYPIRSERSDFSIDPSFERLGLHILTELRFLPPDGTVREFGLGEHPGRVQLDPRWHDVALGFVQAGFGHILGGIDHLLFLLCLVIPFRRFGPLLLIVTSFTVAHTATLIASAFGLAPDALWFAPLVETLIAMSIVYMALENIVGAKIERRWMITFVFGLIHGLGFSQGFGETFQFAGSHLPTSLLSFNVGVELGQILVLLLVIPALGLLFRYGVAERVGIVVLSVLVGHTSWHWMVERWGELIQYPMPEPTASMLASAMRWLMLIIALGGAVWLFSGVLRQWIGVGGEDREAIGGPD